MRDGEREAVLTIPLVVGLVVARVEPAPVVIAVRVKQVQIAVGIARSFIKITALRILSGLYRIRHHNAIKLRTKYLRFFEKHTPRYVKP